MNLAPLQLVDYFVHSISVEALESYDHQKPSDLDPEALSVMAKCKAVEDDKSRAFSIELIIEQKELTGKNLPYRYRLEMVGFLRVHPEFPEDEVERAVRINGPSMLFGAAREILRAATGRGPYGPVLIPSTTFFTPPNIN
ncbi:MAG: protein-export chaperone SecB [Verrucomicrobia bacterium]|nr:protein-export chaperone SecB [Verrucomicrobiota bacterium]